MRFEPATHTTRFLYGTNSANPFFAAAPAEQYEVKVAIDPDGLTSTTVSDQLNNKIASVQGSVNNSDRQQSSVQLDARDNPKTVRTPNFYSSPTGSPSDWQQTAQYDIFGRLTESTTNDAHTASGHPATIAGNRSSETFHYHDGTGTPRYDGLPSALKFRFADAPEVMGNRLGQLSADHPRGGYRRRRIESELPLRFERQRHFAQRHDVRVQVRNRSGQVAQRGAG
jgi:hypothetical protein